MKTSVKGAKKSNQKPPSRTPDRSTDKSAHTSSKNTKNSRSSATSRPTSASLSRKNRPTSPKTKSATPAPKKQAPPSSRSTRSDRPTGHHKATTKSKSISPKSKSASHANTSKSQTKQNASKDTSKKPSGKTQTIQNIIKSKKPPVSKSAARTPSPSPKRAESPKKDTQKTDKTDKTKQKAPANTKPRTVQARASRTREYAKKPREPESRSQSRNRSATSSPAKDKGKTSPVSKGKASPAKKNPSRQTSAKASPKRMEEEEAEEEEEEVVEPQVGAADLLVPDPVSEFVRDSEGHLVKNLTENDKEAMLRMNLDAILEDDDYEVAIKMVNLEARPSSTRNYGENASARQNGRIVQEEEKVRTVTRVAEDDEGYEVREYSLFEDWRLLEAAEAFRAAKGPKGLSSRKTWGEMLDPATGELMFGGVRSKQSLVRRYSGCLSHLTEEEVQMIEQLGTSLAEDRMSRLRGIYRKVDGVNRLLGIHELIYDGSDQRMFLNPSTTRYQNANAISAQEFVKKSVEKLGQEPLKRLQKEGESGEEEKEQRMTRPVVTKSSISPESKGKAGKASKGSKESKGSKGKDSARVVEDENEETKKILMKQSNFLRQKKLKELTKTIEEREREEREPSEQRKKFKSNVGQEVIVVQEKKPEPQVKPLTKREKAKQREQEKKERQLRKTEEELKKLKDPWIYDANSLSLSEVFSERRPLDNITIDPNLSLYVDFDTGFRQFVKDVGLRRASKVSDREMKWAILSRYSKQYGIPLNEIIGLFNRLSCDRQDLELFLTSGDEGLLWTDQEDRDLLNNDQIALRYLAKIKGPLRIKRRKEFLQRLE